jgi:tetraacyldisaccharide 4'-kinase
VNAESGRHAPLNAFADRRVGGFCGLANPDAFWDTLANLGYRPEFRKSYPDHHKYTAGEIARLRSTDTLLLTTAKDAANIPDGSGIWYLEIGIEMSSESEFLHTAFAVCGVRR